MTISLHRCARAFGVVAWLSILGSNMTAATAQDAKAPDYEAIVASPDRSDADRQTDARRQPARMLAFTGARPGMKVLFMSGHTEDTVLKEGIQKGTAFLQKPFTPAILAQKVRETLDSSAASAELV